MAISAEETIKGIIAEATTHTEPADEGENNALAA